MSQSKEQHLVRCQLPVLRVLLRCCCHPRRYHPLVMALVRSVGVSRAVDVLQRVVLYMSEAVHCIQRALRIAAQRMSGVDMPPHLHVAIHSSSSRTVACASSNLTGAGLAVGSGG